MPSIDGSMSNQNVNYTGPVNQTGGIPTLSTDPMAIPSAPPNIQQTPPSEVTEEFAKIRNESPYIAQTMAQPAVGNQWMANMQAEIQRDLEIADKLTQDGEEHVTAGVLNLMAAVMMVNIPTKKTE